MSNINWFNKLGDLLTEEKILYPRQNMTLRNSENDFRLTVEKDQGHLDLTSESLQV
jgi:hypothetical protein